MEVPKLFGNDGFIDSGRTAEKCALHMQSNAALAKVKIARSGLSALALLRRRGVCGSFPIQPKGNAFAEKWLRVGSDNRSRFWFKLKMQPSGHADSAMDILGEVKIWAL